jgi:adenosylcobinamide kinase/adenosylcobinamide-phosphate guanylyltransferase
MQSRTLTLITGGARSGKSSHALALAARCRGGRRGFIATAEALDDEMRERIARHQAERPAAFETIEAPIAIVDALAGFEGRIDTVVIDCLTLWVANLMGRGLSDDELGTEAARLVAALTRASFNAIVVTDEVGWGIVPVDATARRFRDRLGWTNQAVARATDRVILMVAGYPLVVKPAG